MCDWHEHQYLCGHNKKRKVSYCHFARTDEFHQCFGVQSLKETWVHDVLCEDCEIDMQWAVAAKRGASGG
ncbi:hypothetical protein N431DRAFT_303674, partial [Stipitochalara longipes BDJ]